MTGVRTGLVPSAVDSRPGVAANVWCDEREMFVELTDGRLVRHPLPDFVSPAPPERRGEPEAQEFGTAIWWPELDEGVGVNWLFGVSESVIYRLAGFTHRPG